MCTESCRSVELDITLYPGIPAFMKELEVVVALKETVNTTTTLNTLPSENAVALSSLLDIMSLCLFTLTYQANSMYVLAHGTSCMIMHNVLHTES